MLNGHLLYGSKPAFRQIFVYVFPEGIAAITAKQFHYTSFFWGGGETDKFSIFVRVSVKCMFILVRSAFTPIDDDYIVDIFVNIYIHFTKYLTNIIMFYFQ